MAHYYAPIIKMYADNPKLQFQYLMGVGDWANVSIENIISVLGPGHQIRVCPK